MTASFLALAGGSGKGPKLPGTLTPLGGFGGGQFSKMDGWAVQPAKPNRNPKIGHAPGVILIAYKSGPEGRQARQAVERQFKLVQDTRCQSPFFVRYFVPTNSVRTLASTATAAKSKFTRRETIRTLPVKGIPQLTNPDPLIGLDSAEVAVEALRGNPGIRLAELDMQIMPDQAMPNDPSFNLQWGLHNTGQSGGTVDADIDAPEGWAAMTTTPNVLVAVLDDGVAINHPDLAASININAAEQNGAPGVDDDGNGLIDDIRGWDFVTNDNDPSPGGTDTHGTHCAGIVDAVTNNGIGVAGTGRNIEILPVRMYAGQSTWMSDLIRGIDYSRNRGARVISVSYNIDGWTQLLLEAIQRAGQADIVYVNSAGNNAQNIDTLRGRIKLQAPNSTFIAASNRFDQLASFSNFGSTVDMAAPGEEIYATLAGSTPYGYQSGTSMATPMAAAVIGMVRSQFPSLTAPQVIARVAGTSDPSAAFGGRIVNGRVNLNNALDTDAVAPSNPGTPVLNRKSASTLRFTFAASGDDGNTGAASTYEVRMSANPITTANFGSASLVGNLASSVPAGGTVTLPVRGLFPGDTYYIALRARDNVGNASGIVSAGPFRTPSAIYSDRMEGTPQWTGDGTWARTTAVFRSPNNSWTDSPAGNYANSVDTSLVSNTSLPITEPSTLRVSIRYALESGFDFLNIDLSTNNGSTWTTARRLTGSADWTSIAIPMNAFVGQNVRVRFRMTSDSSVVADGVYIDDVVITPSRIVYGDDVEGTGRFTPEGTWQIHNERSSSPTRAWNDSPGVNYVNNLNMWMRGTTMIDASSIADAAVTFNRWTDLENGYDFLNQYASADGTNWSLQASFTGNSGGWVPAAGSAPFDQFFLAFSLTADDTVTANGVSVDDIQVSGEPYVNTLNGNVGLDGYVGPARTYTVRLRNPGTTTTVQSFNVQLGAGQTNFSVDSTQSGMYDVVIEGPGTLRTRLSNLALSVETPVALALQNGDVNGDNAVNNLDINAVRSAWGTTSGVAGWNAAADVNGDGVVGAADLLIIRRNWMQTGVN